MPFWSWAPVSPCGLPVEITLKVFPELSVICRTRTNPDALTWTLGYWPVHSRLTCADPSTACVLAISLKAWWTSSCCWDALAERPSNQPQNPLTPPATLYWDLIESNVDDLSRWRSWKVMFPSSLAHAPAPD